MSKFATRPRNVVGPITTTGETTRTYGGGVGYVRDAKGELFLLAAANMVSESTFYENATDRDERFEKLIHQVVAEDPSWVAGFVPYLRDTMQMRSASIVMAAEYVRAGGPGGRRVVDAALQRGDEPAEMLAYWHWQVGRRIPKPIKRGVADACRRLYTERSSLRYDGTDRPWRMADVIELVHPRPTSSWQSMLFRLLLDKRHHGHLRALEAGGPFGAGGKITNGTGDAVTTGDPILPIIEADARLRALDSADRRAALGQIGAAGWSWERLAGWLPGGMDREAWEAVIPQMGYMALLRNLRNFDEAGVPDDTAAMITAKLTDPDEVARSRQFPIRFLSAYKAVNSLRWAYPLERALGLSLQNVPRLAGRTLIMVDVSGSMTHEGYLHQFHRGWRDRNKFTMPWEHAAIFGLALAVRARDGGGHADVFSYGQVAQHIPIPKAAALLPLLDVIRASRPFSSGTETMQLLAALARAGGDRGGAYDRVIILTDEQAFDARSEFVSQQIAAIPRIYTFNIGGLRAGHLPSGARGRYTFAGLNDAAFRLIPELESLDSGHDWPWVVKAGA